MIARSVLASIEFALKLEHKYTLYIFLFLMQKSRLGNVVVRFRDNDNRRNISVSSVTTTTFDPETFYEGIYLFQKWEVVPGVWTAGPKDVVATLDMLGCPRDLTGKRVLDIAPWNGFFSFECARRGAAEVISVGPEDPLATGYEQTRSFLNLDHVRYVQGSVYDLDTFDLGMFDVVLFLGLIYHLRHPLLALDKIYDLCSEVMLVDSPIIDDIVFDRTLNENARNFYLERKAEVHALPLLYYTEGAETGDDYNWFLPNRLAFLSLVRSSGFNITDHVDSGGWCWISTRKGQRRFELGLEGYNPYATRRLKL